MTQEKILYYYNEGSDGNARYTYKGEECSMVGIAMSSGEDTPSEIIIRVGDETITVKANEAGAFEGLEYEVGE